MTRTHPWPSTVLAGLGFAGLVLLASLSGCAGAGQTPNTASSASPVPGDVPTLGSASVGGLTVTGATITRSGQQLAISASIHNAGPATDVLESIGSQVSPTLTFSPPLQIPAGATRALGGAGVAAVLDEQGRLEPGGTVALILQFQQAGQLQVFSSFH